MSWSRVIWKEKDIEVEEVIPSSWIAGNKVLWPPVSNAGAKKAIRQQWTPDQKLTSFELVRIKMSSDEKKDCDMANITTCDESEESGDDIPLGKRIPKKKSFGTEFTTGSTLETDTSKTSSSKSNLVLPTPPQPPKRLSSETQKSSGVANKKKAPLRISSSKSPSPARSSRSRENSCWPALSQLSRSRSLSRENGRRQTLSRSRSRENSRRRSSRSRENGCRQTFSQLSRSRSRSRSREKSRQTFSQLTRSSRSRENGHRQTFSQLSRSRSRSRENSCRQTFSQLTRSRENSRLQTFSQLSRSRSRSQENSRRPSSRSRENSRHQSSRTRENSRQSSRSRENSRRPSSRSRENSHRQSSRSRENSPHRTFSHLSRSTSSSVYPMSEERFQRRVIYLLTEIRDNVKKGNPFNSIVQSGADDNTLDQYLTLEDFKDFDLTLNVRKDYDICKSIVAQIGGNDYRDHIKKAMQRCMTNKVMSYMNISEKKNKYAFGGSNFFKLIKDVIMRTYNVTENQVVEAIANYLKWAPERKAGGGRKK